MKNNLLQKIKTQLENHESRLLDIERVINSSHVKEQINKKTISIGEFLSLIKPKNDTSKALAIGYFLEHYKNFKSFNIKDLKEGFSKAKEPKPVNMNDKVNLNIKKGFIMESEEKDNITGWILTRSGEEFVKNQVKDLNE